MILGSLFMQQSGLCTFLQGSNIVMGCLLLHEIKSSAHTSHKNFMGGIYLTVQHFGRQSIAFAEKPLILSYASVVGKKEAAGPLADSFDLKSQDTFFGQKSWEQAESRMQQLCYELALEKGKLSLTDLDAAFMGDLLNQCVGSSFSLRDRKVPAFGLYGACSTMAEGLLLGAMAVSGGFCRKVMALTSSHFAASERQYRFPLGYGGQRTPTAQWTVTGAGAVILGSEGKGLRLCHGTIGTIVDGGIKDANNMGAAMAPAAVSTLEAHFRDLNLKPTDYDLIVTGDLGKLGYELVLELMGRKGYDLSANYSDCGMLIYDLEKQDVHCGGSGCGCSAVTLCGSLLGRLKRGELKRLLFCGTGALLSPLSVQQGQSIPAVCHAVSICKEED